MVAPRDTSCTPQCVHCCASSAWVSLRHTTCTTTNLLDSGICSQLTVVLPVPQRPSSSMLAGGCGTFSMMSSSCSDTLKGNSTSSSRWPRSTARTCSKGHVTAGLQDQLVLFRGELLQCSDAFVTNKKTLLNAASVGRRRAHSQVSGACAQRPGNVPLATSTLHLSEWRWCTLTAKARKKTPAPVSDLSSIKVEPMCSDWGSVGRGRKRGRQQGTASILPPRTSSLLTLYSLSSV